MVGPCFRRLALGLVPALVGIISTAPLPAHAVATTTNPYQGFNEFPALAGSQPYDLITGPDGNIWYTAHLKERVVAISPADGTTVHNYYIGTKVPNCGPTGINIGPDHFVWITCYNADVLVRISPSNGALKVYPLPTTPAIIAAGCSCPFFLTPGLDGYLWFDETGPGYISKFNVTTGALIRYPLPAGSRAGPRAITAGPDGNMWFTETFINRIGRMTLAGKLASFAIPTAGSAPWGIAVGPDGNLYYTEVNKNKIGKITTAGVTTTEFRIPTAASGPRLINAGPDGNLWFAEYDAGKIGSVTPAGVFQEAPIPTGLSKPNGVAAGPDGNLWFTESGTNKIGNVGTRHTALTVDSTAIGFGNVPIGTTTPTQRITLTNNGPDPLSAFTPSVVNTGTGGTSGAFTDGGQTCSAAVIPPAGTCYQDISFIATASGTSVGSVDFVTDAGLPYEQTLSVGLSATSNGAACTSAAINTDVSSPQTAGTTVTISASSAGCPDTGPLYRFSIRSPSGTWNLVQDFNTATTYTWNTTGATPGTYLLEVWVKDALSSNESDAYAIGTFALSSGYCSSTNVSSDVPSPQPSGTTVNFTATSIGCTLPLYQWWVADTFGNWTIVPGHDFANSSTTLAWDTTGLIDGTYQLGVWAKQTGSTKSYDAYNFATYTLTVVSGTTHCQAVNQAVSPPSPSNVGQDVTVDATALGCDSPQFKFLVRDISGNWTVVQDYNVPFSRFVWSTGSVTPGTYQLGVWARQLGSNASYEAYSISTYTLNSASCSSVGIAPDVASPQASGTTINFTAAALGCPNPEYRFLVAPPGGPFGETQPYGPSNTFAWNTAGLSDGIYQVGVWARHLGGTAPYDAFAIVTFQLQSNGVPCSTLAAWPTHGSAANDITSQPPQPAGASIVWSAVAQGGCPQAEYSFYLLRPGGIYRLIQGYSTTATATWNTAGISRGMYHIKVLARGAGSATVFDVFAISSFEVV